MTDQRIGDWIQTMSGRQFWPLDPRPSEIHVVDIAHALSNMCRFTGHVRSFYSVAQHSVLVATRVPKEFALWGLLHDASEAYLSDIATPVKKQPIMEGYRVAERQLIEAVCFRFGLPVAEPEAVKEADARALATEVRDLTAPSFPKQRAEPYPIAIESWSPEVAKSEFLRAYVTIMNTGLRGGLPLQGEGAFADFLRDTATDPALYAPVVIDRSTA